jgi:hypothetical protein
VYSALLDLSAKAEACPTGQVGGAPAGSKSKMMTLSDRTGTTELQYKKLNHVTQRQHEQPTLVLEDE